MAEKRDSKSDRSDKFTETSEKEDQMDSEATSKGTSEIRAQGSSLTGQETSQTTPRRTTPQKITPLKYQQTTQVTGGIAAPGSSLTGKEKSQTTHPKTTPVKLPYRRQPTQMKSEIAALGSSLTGQQTPQTTQTKTTIPKFPLRRQPTTQVTSRIAAMGSSLTGQQTSQTTHQKTTPVKLPLKPPTFRLISGKIAKSSSFIGQKTSQDMGGKTTPKTLPKSEETVPDEGMTIRTSLDTGLVEKMQSDEASLASVEKISKDLTIIYVSGKRDDEGESYLTEGDLNSDTSITSKVHEGSDLLIGEILQHTPDIATLIIEKKDTGPPKTNIAGDDTTSNLAMSSESVTGKTKTVFRIIENRIPAFLKEVEKLKSKGDDSDEQNGSKEIKIPPLRIFDVTTVKKEFQAMARMQETESEQESLTACETFFLVNLKIINTSKRLHTAAKNLNYWYESKQQEDTELGKFLRKDKYLIDYLKKAESDAENFDKGTCNI